MKMLSCCALLVCLTLSGCSSPESRFEAAQKEGTIEAYQGFIDTYPDHVLAEKAKTTLARLRWESIKDTDDLVAFADYVARYSDGEFGPAAAAKLEDLEFAAARRENTLSAWRTFLSRYPDSRYAAEGLEAVLDASETEGSFQYEESLATGSGFMVSAPDGSIESYPDGTALTITIKDNDSGVSYNASGEYVTMIDVYALFELGEGQFYVRLPSGFMALCFCDALPGQQQDLTAEQQMYQRWCLRRLQSMIGFVQENKDSNDPEIISILGALQIPHARRELDHLCTAGSQKVQSLARQSVEVWQKIRERACL